MTKRKQTKPLDEPLWDFPFEVMEVGDSFFVPTMKPAYMTYVADSGAKRAGVKVKVFTTTHDGTIGVRVWRVG